MLAVEVGLNVPHDPAGEQLQVTPAFAVSFVTVAATIADPETDNAAGGACEMETEIRGGGGAVIVTGED